MLNYGSIVGNQEDWADIITNVEDEEGMTPFIDWLPTGDKPVNVERSYQAEQYDDPEENAHIDGKPVSGFKAAGDGRGRLKAVVQYFTKAASVKRLHQDVSEIAGIGAGGELGRDIMKRTIELKRDIEAACLMDTESQDDTGVQGYKTRGAFKWVQATAQSDRPVPTAFLTPSAQVSTTATGSLTENTILDILQSIGTTTKSKAPVTAFCGPSFKRAFNNMALGAPTIALVGGAPVATQVQYSKNGQTINRVFSRYESDFGPIDVPGIAWFLLSLGAASSLTKAYSCLFLHQKMWRWSWGPGAPGGKTSSGKPQWYRKEYQGGAYEAFCESIGMLECLNPKGEGKYQPTS